MKTTVFGASAFLPVGFLLSPLPSVAALLSVAAVDVDSEPLALTATAAMPQDDGHADETETPRPMTFPAPGHFFDNYRRRRCRLPV
ncbi:hypothetical protein AB0E08_06070 [Streptomyces sp. NPDC048281]|uniref:hypothetical protein n=1 Tax=Streptomyces sp. NPDC048281 TaxID=3154715 RepID=UPI00344AC1E3